MNLRDAWERHSGAWIRWARAPDHDSYWRFHRESFLSSLPPPGRLTLDVGCGEGRVFVIEELRELYDDEHPRRRRVPLFLRLTAVRT